MYPPTRSVPMATLVIGAAGAVGKRLVNALSKRGEKLIVADRLPHLPENLVAAASVAVPNIDVRDAAGIKKLFRDHPGIGTVWNLAAPLSVETAMDPSVAEAVTIGGMRNVLDGMCEAGVRRICFTDSIGSFGTSAPRKGCTARWLTENPTQDPGSDYGRQKRGCRELMMEFAEKEVINGWRGDPRFAVLPGVLHAEPFWGKGTTEYALDAIQAAARGEEFECPVEPNVVIPMIYSSDLMRGLIALQDAPESRLREPEKGYCIPGLSFSAEELFQEIRRHKPDFKFTVKLDENMNKFAKCWPDTLCIKAPDEDLSYSPKVGLREMVAHVMTGHEERLARSRVAFRTLDTSGDGTFGKKELKDFLYELLHTPDDMSADVKNQITDELVEQAFAEIDFGNDGKVNFHEFDTWSKSNTLCQVAKDFIKEKNV